MKRFAIILVLIVLASTAYAQRPKKAVKAYEAAEEAFMKRDYQKAHQHALKAVLEDPNYAEAWLLEGEIGMETQNYDLATLGFENALSSDSLCAGINPNILAMSSTMPLWRRCLN